MAIRTQGGDATDLSAEQFLRIWRTSMRTTIPGSRVVAAVACVICVVHASGCMTILRDPQSLSSASVERADSTANAPEFDLVFHRSSQSAPPEIHQPGRVIALVAQTEPSTQAAGVPATMPETTAGTATPLAVVGDLRPIGSLSLDVTPPPGDFPPDHASARFLNEPALATGSAERRWGMSSYCWTPPAICHGPLYFEERGLERHGQHVCKLQPVLSAVHFFGRVPALPYLMAAEPPGTLVSPLGQHRPGTRAPCDIELPPADLTAALVQGGVVTGLFFLIP